MARTVKRGTSLRGGAGIRKQSIESLSETLRDNPQGLGDEGAQSPPYFLGNRIPFLITTEQRIQRPTDFRRPYLALTVNPEEISYQQTLRAAEQKTRAGTILYAWRSSDRQTFFDNPIFTISYQSGNTLPFAYLGKRDLINGDIASAYSEQPIPPGQKDFYDFQGILNETKHYGSRPNYVYQIINTRLFPEITLVGFFSPEGFTVVENANDPNQIKWSLSFICRHTMPRLHSPSELIEAFHAHKLTVPQYVQGASQGNNSETGLSGVPATQPELLNAESLAALAKILE